MSEECVKWCVILTKELRKKRLIASVENSPTMTMLIKLKLWKSISMSARVTSYQLINVHFATKMYFNKTVRCWSCCVLELWRMKCHQWNVIFYFETLIFALFPNSELVHYWKYYIQVLFILTDVNVLKAHCWLIYHYYRWFFLYNMTILRS